MRSTLKNRLGKGISKDYPQNQRNYRSCFIAVTYRTKLLMVLVQAFAKIFSWCNATKMNDGGFSCQMAF